MCRRSLYCFDWSIRLMSWKTTVAKTVDCVREIEENERCATCYLNISNRKSQPERVQIAIVIRFVNSAFVMRVSFCRVHTRGGTKCWTSSSGWKIKYYLIIKVNTRKTLFAWASVFCKHLWKSTEKMFFEFLFFIAGQTNFRGKRKFLIMGKWNFNRFSSSSFERALEREFVLFHSIK